MDELTDALAKMAAIESRISTVENSQSERLSSAGAVDTQALARFQLQMITRLKDIRTAMEQSGGDVVQVTNERNALQDVNNQLKKQIERMNYRINHLVKELEKEEEKHI